MNAPLGHYLRDGSDISPLLCMYAQDAQNGEVHSGEKTEESISHRKQAINDRLPAVAMLFRILSRDAHFHLWLP